VRRLGLIGAEQEAELHHLCTALIAALTGRIRDLERLDQRKVGETRVGYDATDELEGSEVPGF
jgi:hypothetical protein